jgi:hypothetical protein
MKRPINLLLSGAVCAGGLVISLSGRAAALPADWQNAQQFNVTAPGLIKLSLPVETLDAARPALEDLRLYDAAGDELPFLIERPTPTGQVTQSARSFSVSLSHNTTVITLETGLAQSLDAVTLDTPAQNFIKPVQIEGSSDGHRWQTFVHGRPIFRQPGGASQLRLAIPSGNLRSLRFTVDDLRSRPIPFTGAWVHATAESVSGEPLPVAIAERHENPGVTRLTLNLGAANLDIASLQIETSEPLFTRQVTLVVPRIAEDAIREQIIGQGVVYRVAIEGRPASDGLAVPLERQVRSREMLLLIRNQDSPPLPITAMRAERRPVYLVFLARQAGDHHLLTGNSRCAAPRYDLAALGLNLKAAAVSPLKPSALAENPDYRVPEILPGIEQDGTALDVSAWKFRAPVKLTRAGAQQLEPGLDVLAHANPGFADLRLVRLGRQVPYILERTSISRSLTPSVTATNDARDGKLSRWIIRLPKSRLPITRLSCATRAALFQRDVTLYEELTDDRGSKYRHHLTSASWTQTPDRTSREFSLAFDSPLQGDTLFLETHNGDNPPVELEKFQLFYLATRVLFKAKPDDAVFLYYGNPRVSSPRYDLSLVAGQLLAADKSPASLADEEQLKKSSWAEGRTPGKGGVFFWGTLAVVVVALLVIISRLLPRAVH